MITLSLRTDNPEAEIGLYNDDQQLAYHKWQAHRQLAESLHQEIHKLLSTQQLDWPDIGAVVVYQGPGSFTGLRIGISVANSLAYSQNIPIIGTGGKGWIEEGLTKLQAGQNDTQVMPEYGHPPHITQPKK